MHNICIDEQKNLTVKFELTNDYTQDYMMDEYLRAAKFIKNSDGYIFKNNDIVKFRNTLKWVVDYFRKHFEIENVNICQEVEIELDSIQNNKNLFEKAQSVGEEIKQKNIHGPNISKTFHRTLMNYQKKSVEHLLALGNAANFSVPGSGKTTIAYAAISRWLEDEEIEKILVIGPTASFLPWEEEYEICFNRKPKPCRLQGKDASSIHEMGDDYDLFLMHFNTAINYEWELQKFMDTWKTALIVDESHYIKNPSLGRWATMALKIAPYAKHRIVLSGTPMPNDERDLWTQITFLWPNNRPLGNQMDYNRYVNKHGGVGKYKQILNSLFCRINKNDLQLPPQKWTIHKIPLSPKQREIYNIIAAKTLKEIKNVTRQDHSQLQKFRIAKMVRLLQTASNPSLLYEKSTTFDVHAPTFSEEFGLALPPGKLLEDDSSITDKIINYSKHEIPTKIIKAAQLAKRHVEKGNKVIIWNSFINNMSVFKQSTIISDYDPIIINGNIPKDPKIPDNRDERINEFKNSTEPKILIASPASLGESVSLHKNSKHENVCNHAIYLDRNFNGAQYMQSMDRIHRIGMDANVEVNYDIIIGIDTIDERIHNRLKEKWTNMLTILKDDMLHSLDINPEPEENNPTEIDRDYKEMVEHLRELSEKNDFESI